MTGYELSRKWFDFCYENTSKIKPIHTALFFFVMEHNNRLGWKAEFGLPRQMAMDAIGVKNNKTYSSAFNDLEEWGFINVIERSKNQYSANIISLFGCVKNTPAPTKALDKAMLKHLHKQSISIAPIDKPINIETKKQEETNSPSMDLVKTTEQIKQIETIYEIFINEIKEGYHSQWAESSYMSLKIKKGTLTPLLKDFKHQLIKMNKLHKTTLEVRNHFDNWLNKLDSIGKLNQYKTVKIGAL